MHWIRSYYLPKRWGLTVSEVTPPEETCFKVIKLPKRWGVYNEEHPQKIFLLALSHCDGSAFLFVAFPVENIVLSVDLSVDEVL